MDRTVTPETMRKVQIQKGWLIRQFASYVFGVTDNPRLLYDLEIPPERDEDWFKQYPARIRLAAEFAEALIKWDELVARKNEQYEDAWQVDGPVTALADLKDKLYRLGSASKSGAILEWDPDKKRGTIFDIIVRAMMVLAWDELNFADDDDDGRKVS